MEIKLTGYESPTEYDAAMAAINILRDHAVACKDQQQTLGDLIDDVPPPPAAVTAEPPADVPPVPGTPAETTPEPPTTMSGDLDKEGVPWDARIHASSKLKTAKGVWKRRRGVDDAEYAAIVAELKGSVVTTPDVPPVPGTPAATTPDVPPPPTTPPAEVPAEPVGTTWADVIGKVMAARNEDRVNQEQLDNTAIQLGVQGGFRDMINHGDLYDMFLVTLGL